METEGAGPVPLSAEQARAALAQVASAETQVITRLAYPSWYYPSLGACVFVAFASASIDYAAIPYGMIGGLGIGAPLLTIVASHATGVHPDQALLSKRVNLNSAAFLLGLILLAAAGLTVEWILDLRGAMVGCGLLAWAAIILVGRRLDAAIVADALPHLPQSGQPSQPSGR